MRKRVWSNAIVACILSVALALGGGYGVGRADATERWVEQWICVSADLGGLMCLGEDARTDCLTVSLTSDFEKEEGTIQVSGMKRKRTSFTYTQFDRGWVWPVNDPKYVFVIVNERTGMYYRSLDAQNRRESASGFYCERVPN